MMFVTGPDQSYQSADGYRLQWRGYRDNDKRSLFDCTCFDYVEAGICEHAQNLTRLYQFADRYWPDAAATFHGHLHYYQREAAKREDVVKGT